MDDRGLLVRGVFYLGAGVAAVLGSWLVKRLERYLYLLRTPLFSDFGLLKRYLRTLPNQSSMVLIEGSVEPLDVYGYGFTGPTYLKGRYTQLSGAGSVILITAENSKSELVENDIFPDAPRFTEYQRTSVPFSISESHQDIVAVCEIHKSIGFDQLLELAEDKCTSSGHMFNDLFGLIKTSEFTKLPSSIRYQEYLLMFSTKFGGYGRAYLQKHRFDHGPEIITFFPEKVGLSIKSLIKSHKYCAQGLWLLSWLLFVGGGLVIIFIAAPCIWKYLKRRLTAKRPR